MIIIFSSKEDNSTTRVMAYLHNWNQKVIRLNREDTLAISYHIEISKKGRVVIALEHNGHLINLTDIKSIWFRRGGFYFKEFDQTAFIKDKEILFKQFINYFTEEQKTLNAFIYNTFLKSGIKILGNPFVMNTSKLCILKNATECGLDIPPTLITTSKNSLSDFIQTNHAIITKAIQDNICPVTSSGGYYCLTEQIDLSNLGLLPDSFFPSLFQQKIEKEFEIRIFYLDGAFFSIAIFSQENKQTAVDFRNYDYKNPNRKMIINLPASVKHKLLRLLNDLNLNTASIDMLFTVEKKYVFLEVNPVGEYDMVGRLMNMQLDKKIAKWLI